MILFLLLMMVALPTMAEDMAYDHAHASVTIPSGDCHEQYVSVSANNVDGVLKCFMQMSSYDTCEGKTLSTVDNGQGQECVFMFDHASGTANFNGVVTTRSCVYDDNFDTTCTAYETEVGISATVKVAGKAGLSQSSGRYRSPDSKGSSSRHKSKWREGTSQFAVTTAGNVVHYDGRATLGKTSQSYKFKD